MEDKLILNEDLDLDITDYTGQTFEDLYDVQGIEVLSDDNIESLKRAGLLNEKGYPVKEVESWRGEMVKQQIDLYDLFVIDSDFIKMNYVKELLVKEIYEHASADENGTIRYVYSINDLPSIRELSTDFIEGCFIGDVWEFFDSGDYAFRDCRYVIDDVPSEVLDVLESYGFPRDIYKKLMDGDADEDSPLAEWYDDLENALVSAYRCGEEDGSAAAAIKDFDSAFEESIPDGCEWLSRESNDSDRPINVSKDFIEKSVEGIWEYMDTYSSNSYDAFTEYLLQTINEGLAENFREPYYGWQDFDSDSFADRLMDEILELNIPLSTPVDLREPEEENLLNFNGDTGEYHEDLDLQTIKPKKLQRVIQDYNYLTTAKHNSELSSVAYRLDAQRVALLLDFAKHGMADVDINELEDELEFNENPEITDVYISKIKPSFKGEFTPVSAWWNVWMLNRFYEARHIGTISKGKGEQLIRGLREDLELDIAPIPNVKIGGSVSIYHPTEFLQELIANRCDMPSWVVQWYNLDTEEYDNHNFDNLSDAIEYYNNYKLLTNGDTLIIMYIPPLDDKEYDPETYTITGRKGPDGEKLTEEERWEDYTYYEVYMERADKTTWDFELQDFANGEPSTYNQSVVIKVADDMPEPTPLEVEEFLASIGLLPEGYVVLYLSEDGADYIDIEEDNIPTYVPPGDLIDINR